MVSGEWSFLLSTPASGEEGTEVKGVLLLTTDDWLLTFENPLMGRDCNKKNRPRDSAHSMSQGT